MPETNPKCFHLSASSIAAWKACGVRYRLAYREGLRLAEDTESQRVGTRWHKMHEIFAEAWPDQVNPEQGVTPQEIALEAVVAHLNQQYKTPPAHKTAEEWNLERTILLTSFIAYQWYYQNDPLEFLASEVPFGLPLLDPRVGMPLPKDEVLVVGKIDHVVKWQGAVCNLERKSTSRSIADDSDYWQRGQKDTQVSMYALAFKDMRAAELLPRDLRDEISWGGEREQPVPRYGNTLYDVWRKPTIKPAMLTQKETAEFVASGEYCGQKFEVTALPYGVDESGTLINPPRVQVNGQTYDVEVGKKGFAIHETADMFAARLLADMYERPDFYFKRKEIARTDVDLIRFRQQLYAAYQGQKFASRTGCFLENESSCRDPFPCAYLPICYGPGAEVACDGKNTPQGFKRIFVDLTINGEPTSD